MVLLIRKYLTRFSNLKLRFRIMFCALLVLCLLGLMFTYRTESELRSCFMTPAFLAINDADADISAHRLHIRTSTLRPLDDVLTSRGVKPSPGRSIFFHETSCHRSQRSSGSNNDTPSMPTVQPHLAQLNARQACAIESAALHHPNMSVFVLFASAVYLDNNTYLPLVDAVLSYPNVHLRNLNLWTYAANTPTSDWINNGELFRSRYVLSHLSDFLRYLTLWRYGGLYLDLDVIVLRNMESLPPNYTGAESEKNLAAGVMSFAAEGFGHDIAMACLDDFQQNFDGNIWGNNGPGVITRVMRNVCELKNVAEMLQRQSCKGFHIFNSSAFYAVHFEEWDHFFEAQYLQETLNRTQNSYVVHVWNKFSAQRRVKIGSKSAYGQIAAKHCPRVYAAAGEYF